FCELVVSIVIVMNPNELAIKIAEISAQLGLEHTGYTGCNSTIPGRGRRMRRTRNSIVTRNGPLAGAIRVLPPNDICHNRIRIHAGLIFGVDQCCDDSGNGLVHLINLISVIAVVLDDERRAYTCEYDNEFARQPTQALTPALLLI